MDNMKYVIVEYRGCELPILFDPILGHDQVVNPNIGALRLSAGEVSFVVSGVLEEILVSCWGQSITLGLKSRGESDEKLIKKLINKE